VVSQRGDSGQTLWVAARQRGGARIPFQVAKMVLIKLCEVCSSGCGFESNLLTYLLRVDVDKELRN
jgi:hypothetical protein